MRAAYLWEEDEEEETLSTHCTDTYTNIHTHATYPSNSGKRNTRKRVLSI